MKYAEQHFISALCTDTLQWNTHARTDVNQRYGRFKLAMFVFLERNGLNFHSHQKTR